MFCPTSTLLMDMQLFVFLLADHGAGWGGCWTSHPTPVQYQAFSGCGSAAAVMVISQPDLLPWPEEREKRRKAFVPVGWTTPAAATGCGADAFCLQSSLFCGRQDSAKINQYSMNLWSALVFWVTSLSLMGSVMLRDVALDHTDVLSHSGHSASHFISHVSGSFAFPDQHVP